MPGGDERGIDGRHHGSLAVGPGYVHGPERPLGMPERGDQRLDVVEAELDAELFEPEQPVDGIERLRTQESNLLRVGWLAPGWLRSVAAALPVSASRP